MLKHISKVAPKSVKVLFENDRVRVSVVSMRRGDKFGPHSYVKGISYNLDGGRIRATDTDGRVNEVEFRSGEASWSDDGESLGVENLGGAFRMLSVELKESRGTRRS